jgi:mono/diheme cytochrome c family protein
LKASVKLDVLAGDKLMKLNRVKFFVIAIITLPMFAIAAFNTSAVRAVSSTDEDVAATYKAKCAMCHSPKAEKLFDTAKTDEQHIEVILKGKKGEKPPFMPGFEAKGMTPEQAKALVTHMRELKKPAN